MAVVNIPRDVKDEFYRYKMPALIAKVEGKGNGIKTVIVNMVEIAKSLDRPPAYATKFFGFELGTITSIEADKSKYIVNGKHDQPRLAQVLDDFIEKFILCKKCGRNPETTMLLKSGVIELKCKACGNRSPVDMRHKLCTFILKNPPGELNGTPSKGEKKSSKKQSKKKGSSDEDDGADSKDVDEPKLEEEKLPRSASKKKKKEVEEDEVVWYTDTSKEAAEIRRRQMLDETSEIAAQLLKATTSDRADPVERLKQFLSSGSPSNEQIIAEILKIQSEDKLDNEEIARIVVLGVFDKDFLLQLKSPKADLLKKFAPEGQYGTLAGISELCGTIETSLLKSVPIILKTIYDLEYLEEDVIISWGNAKAKGADAKVKESAKVFVDWLSNAEEESSDED